MYCTWKMDTPPECVVATDERIKKLRVDDRKELRALSSTATALSPIASEVTCLMALSYWQRWGLDNQIIKLILSYLTYGGSGAVSAPPRWASVSCPLRIFKL